MQKKAIRVRGAGILAVLVILLACLAVCAGAAAEAVPVDTEDANGRITQTVWTDEAGNMTAGPEGYASVRYSYKGKTEVTEKYFGVDGTPFRTAEGCCGKRTTLDGKGRPVQIDWLDAAGEKTLNVRGYASVTMTYTGFGETALVTYLGLNKRAVMVPSLGYASVLTEFSNGRMTARTYRDEKGKPVDSAEGYAVVKQKLNKKYQVIRIRYAHADDSPATGPDGWYRCIMDRDDAGRILSIKYYDVGENLTDRGASYAWEERSYPDENTVEITRYDMSGNKVADASGVATVVRVMQDDRVSRERFLDVNGQPTVNELGAGTVVYGYDHAGRLETVTYQTTEGVTAACNKGYAGYRDTLDDDGATLTRTYLGPEGLPVEIGEGYCEIRYYYDAMKNLTGKRYYNANGTQVKAE